MQSPKKFVRIITVLILARRLGNWCEESILREEKLAAFLKKVDGGKAEFMRKDKRIEIANIPTTVSEDYHYGTCVMLKSSFTNNHLAAVLPESFPEVSQSEEVEVATAINQNPQEGKARSCFIFEKFDENNAPDDRLRYGDKFYIFINLPGLDKPVSNYTLTAALSIVGSRQPFCSSS